jgi:hypothetical protein
MLSWSGQESDIEVDLQVVARGAGDAGVPFSVVLLQFATEAGRLDDDHAGLEEMAVARRRLVDAVGESMMIDAAAVAANFHMMTRLADGTGARYPQARLDAAASTIAIMGSDSMSSFR